MDKEFYGVTKDLTFFLNDNKHPEKNFYEKLLIRLKTIFFTNYNDAYYYLTKSKNSKELTIISGSKQELINRRLALLEKAFPDIDEERKSKLIKKLKINEINYYNSIDEYLTHKKQSILYEKQNDCLRK